MTTTSISHLCLCTVSYKCFFLLFSVFSLRWACGQEGWAEGCCVHGANSCAECLVCFTLFGGAMRMKDIYYFRVSDYSHTLWLILGEDNQHTSPLSLHSALHVFISVVFCPFFKIFKVSLWPRRMSRRMLCPWCQLLCRVPWLLHTFRGSNEGEGYILIYNILESQTTHIPCD